MLWLKVSGRASMTVLMASLSPLKSGVRTSTAQPGTWARISRMVAAKIAAPPSSSSARFIDVELRRLAGENGAEAAGAGADVAQDHEGRGAVVPALADVRAARLLADGVEVEAAHGLSYIAVALSHGRPGFKPLGPP